MKYLLLISVLLSLASCSNIRSYKANKNVNQNSSQYNATFLSIDSNNVANYVCNDFVLHALKNYTIASMSQEYRFLKSSHETTINIHNPSITDTIYSFSNNRNTVRYYRANSREIIFIFDVTNPKLALINNVKTGMSKSDFMQKFKITKNVDSNIQLINSEGNTKFLFVFNKNKLNRITTDLYID